MLAQRFQLRAEKKRAARCDGVVERFFARAVAGDEKLSAARVPHCEGKHAPQVLHALRAKLFERMNDRLRIRMRFETMAKGFQLVLQLTVVIDLAVENNFDCAIASRHRLVPARQVNDRKPPHPKRNWSLEK